MKNIFVLLLTAAFVLPALADSRAKFVDPDTAYKNNCMRCHSAVRQYSPRMTGTLVTHMQVRANLTQEEAQAILRYLTESSPKKSATATPRRSN